MFAAHVLHDVEHATLATFTTQKVTAQVYVLYSWLHFVISQYVSGAILFFA